MVFQRLSKGYVLSSTILRHDTENPKFITHFYEAVKNNNLEQITAAYESGWNRLTEKYYARQEWPEAEIIAPLVENGEESICLVGTLY